MVSMARMDRPCRLYDRTRFAALFYAVKVGPDRTPVILQVRLYALYYLNKKILALMVIWFLAATVSSAVIMGTTTAVLGGIPFLPTSTKQQPLTSVR
jgi:hypothetical protein